MIFEGQGCAGVIYPDTSHRLFFSVFVVSSGLLKPSQKKTRRQEMETKDYRNMLRTRLLARVQKVAPVNAEVTISHIIAAHTDVVIEDCVNGSDAGVHALIDETKKSMMPSWTQGQPSQTVEGIQAPPAVQIGNSQLRGSPSVPDDGMLDFLAPPWNSQGHPSSTSVGIQAAAGQIVTSQVPDDKSIDLKEHSQLSSVPGCSNVTGSLSSSSRPWPEICPYYISRRGLCRNGLNCEFSHGFGQSGKLEMQIREILWTIPSARVFVLDLPFLYFQWYNRPLQVGREWDFRGLPSLLEPLHTVCWIPGSYGRHFPVPQRENQHFLVLVEHSQSYLGYSNHLHDWEALKEEGANKIYICFPSASRPICTRRNVYHYFSQYGPVMSVKIPNQFSFGFVTFQYPETVRLLLSEWNPEIPHFILEAAVRVYRYIPKGEAKLKNSSVKQELENSPPSHSQMEINPPEALPGGDVTGSWDGDSEDHGQPSHSQVEIDHPEGGEVPDGLRINPVEGGQVLGGMGIRLASARWLKRSSGRSTDR